VNVGAAGVLSAVLLGLAVVLWPGRASTRSSVAGLGAEDVLAPCALAGHGARRGAGADTGGASDDAASSLWQQDPVDLYRQWRLRRRPGDLVDDVLDLLRGMGPALGAGLTPTRAIELAAMSTLGADRVRAARESRHRRSRRSDRTSSRRVSWRPSRRAAAGSMPQGPSRSTPLLDDVDKTDEALPAGGAGAGSAPRADIDRLVGALLDASDRADPISPIWAAWAERSASAELSLVAAAWRLSETTGAPLASAVDRAVRGLLDARARRGKVAVAVAGPRATVTVLTLLPLTGPLFGLACGIDPVALYLGSPIATFCAALGLALVWVGRVWCTRMVRRAVRP